MYKKRYWKAMCILYSPGFFLLQYCGWDDEDSFGQPVSIDSATNGCGDDFGLADWELMGMQQISVQLRQKP